MTNDPAQSGDARLKFPAEVARGRLIAVLPSAPASNLMAPVEVMIQERVRAFSLPAHDVEPVSYTHLTLPTKRIV